MDSAAIVTLRAVTTLDGKTPAGSDFTFLLKDSSGSVVQTKRNQGANVLFNSLSFREAGTFVYYMTQEDAGADIQSDPSRYKITVTVTGGGGYQAFVTYEKDGQAYAGTPAFANSTADISLGLPVTGGSESNALLYAAFALCLAAAIAARAARRRAR